jgi:hypothetical protein
MTPFGHDNVLHVLVPLALGAALALAITSVIAARSFMLRPRLLDEPSVASSRARLILRTITGVAFVGVGFALLVLPGPGVLMIALGAMLLGPAWRAKAIRWVLARPRVLREINAFRRRHGCPAWTSPPSS